MVLALTAGSIAVYDNRAKLFPKEQRIALRSSTRQAPIPKTAIPVPAKAPQVASRGNDTSNAAVTASRAPMPPMPIPQVAGSIATVSPIVTAAISAQRPSNDTQAQPSETKLVTASQQFSFCGRSGLTNCVEDGRVFWRDGKKRVLAGINVPRTDDAACVEERRKGYAAKLRLREFLNAGNFSETVGQNNIELSRAGQSFERQLLSEGLAVEIGKKNLSWCG